MENDNRHLDLHVFFDSDANTLRHIAQLIRQDRIRVAIGARDYHTEIDTKTRRSVKVMELGIHIHEF